MISFRFSATTVDAKHTEFAESRDLCEACDVNVDHRCEHGRPGARASDGGAELSAYEANVCVFPNTVDSDAHARDDRESCDFLIES